MDFESDIFKLLMIVLLMANDKNGDKNNFLTDINQIIILALLFGSNRYNNRDRDLNCNDNNRNRNPNNDTANPDRNFVG